MPRQFSKNQIPFTNSSAFSYENINVVLTGENIITLIEPLSEESLYHSTGLNTTVDEPIVFIKLAKEIGFGAIRASSGYKLHVSLAHDEVDNVARGWDLIKDCLIKHDVELAKVISREYAHLLAEHPLQCGKEVTIYLFRERHKKPLDWQPLIQEITQKLHDAKIIPGRIPPSDKPIKGSHYVNYRNDKLDRYYKVDHSPDLLEPLLAPSNTIKQEDDSPEDDPYQNIVVTVANQLPRALFPQVHQDAIPFTSGLAPILSPLPTMPRGTNTNALDSKIDSTADSEQNLQHLVEPSSSDEKKSIYQHAPHGTVLFPKTPPVLPTSDARYSLKCCTIT